MPKLWILEKNLLYLLFIILFMTSASELVFIFYYNDDLIFVLIKLAKRKKRYDLSYILRTKSKWHAYEINQGVENNVIIHFCLI